LSVSVAKSRISSSLILIGLLFLPNGIGPDD